MNLNAAALKLMAAKGLTLEDVAEIVAANEDRKDPTAAARMARMRARNKKKSVTRNVTPEPPIDNIHTPEVSEDKSSSPPFVLPADIPAEPWAGWIEMRKRIKKSPTDNARNLAIAELRRLRDEEGWPPGDVLNHCTMNSYQGIYPPKDRRNAKPANANHPGLGKTSAAIASLGDWNDDRPM